jgi:hypothetical protein
MRALRSSHPHVRSLSSRLAPRSFAFFRASAKHIERGWRPEGGVKALKFKLRHYPPLSARCIINTRPNGLRAITPAS